ncbi:MAG: hypothetical protein ACKVQR_15435, partial [Aquabacterium sp.]
AMAEPDGIAVPAARPARGTAAATGPDVGPGRPARPVNNSDVMSVPAGWPPVGPRAIGLDAAVTPSAAWASLAPAAAPIAALPASPATPPAAVPLADWVFIGRLDDGSGPRAVLSGPQRTQAVTVGDIVDGQWQVMALPGDEVLLRHRRDGREHRMGFKPS